MEKARVEQLLTQADSALDLASEEQMRPEEDVVPFSICHNSRISIRMYLMSFLIKNGKEPDGNDSMANLLNQCVEIDKDFSTLDISEFECGGSKENHNNNEYCLSVNKVSSCFNAAREVKKLVHSA